jgi:hypothetical protein
MVVSVVYSTLTSLIFVPVPRRLTNQLFSSCIEQSPTKNNATTLVLISSKRATNKVPYLV